MNILLSGSTGFVGRNLKKRLEKEGHYVISYLRGTDLSAFMWISEMPHVDAIIHCAGEINEPSKMVESNVALTERLLTFAKELRVDRFIHIGSSSEYGVTNLPRREDTVCVPACLYDATKLAATALCQGYAAQYDMNICVARPFSLYGPKDTPRKLIPRLYQSYVSHSSIDLYAGSHDWLFIDDFLDGLVMLLGLPREQTKGQIFNFGTGISSSNLEVVKALEEAIGNGLFWKRHDSYYNSYDTQNWVADWTKVKELGWKPKFMLTEGLKELVKREREYGSG